MFVHPFSPFLLSLFLHSFVPLFLHFFSISHCSFVNHFVFFILSLLCFSPSFHAYDSFLFFPPFLHLSHFLSVPLFLPPTRLHSLFPSFISAFVCLFLIFSDSCPVVINGLDLIVSKRKWSGSNGVRRKSRDPSHVTMHIQLASNLLRPPPLPRLSTRK